MGSQTSRKSIILLPCTDVDFPLTFDVETFSPVTGVAGVAGGLIGSTFVISRNNE